MNDILLLIIVIILLLQTHATQKNMGWYGGYYVFVKKRILRSVIRKITGGKHGCKKNSHSE